MNATDFITRKQDEIPTFILASAREFCEHRSIFALLPRVAKLWVNKHGCLESLTVNHHMTFQWVPGRIESDICQPLAAKIAAGLWSFLIGPAAETVDAVRATDIGWLVEFIDIRETAAQRALTATASFRTTGVIRFRRDR